MSLSLPSNILYSTSRDVSVNLALEERLMAEVSEGRSLLFLYENDPAVVIGRFQNPWRECRTGLARQTGTKIRRRISGGGTVVHGPGNLNFAVITGGSLPDREGNLDRIIRALADVGVYVVRNDRYDLRMPPLRGRTDSIRSNEGPKVSGSAFRQTSRSSLHHATLLVNARLEDVKGLLHQPPRDMDARGVESRPSPVVNLSDFVSGLTVDSVVRALAREWGADAPALLSPGEFSADEAFSAARAKLDSPNWIWGKTPLFRERFSNIAGYPGSELEIAVDEGHVSIVPAQAAFLQGADYQGAALLEAGGPGAPAWLAELARRVDGDGDGLASVSGLA